MNKIFLFLFLLASFSCTQFPEHPEIWVKKNYSKKELLITMRDGVRLYTVAYLPVNPKGTCPVLLLRTPYSCRPYGENEYNPLLWKSYWRRYLEEGYIVVFQDVRGKWMSEGEYEDMVDRPEDTYDTVDWLVGNLTANNGRVGLFGISYPGFYAIKGALSGHPAIKAVSPQAPAIDWFMGDDFHHNGAFMLEDAFRFRTGNGQPRRKPTSQPSPGIGYYDTDNYSFYLKTGAIRNFTRLTGDSIRFWNDMMQHPDYDDWWKERDVRRSCYGIGPAVLVVGGLFDTDDCFGAWSLYRAIKEQSPATDVRLVFGPWYHGAWMADSIGSLGHIRFGSNTSADYQENIEIPFFNFHLKETGTIEYLPEAAIFFTGSNQWHSFDEWPPKMKRDSSLFFQENGILDFNPPEKLSSSVTYVSDPSAPVPYMDGVQKRRVKEYMISDQRFASRRPDVITFRTQVLDEDLVLAGELIADLKVSVSTTDADFVVKVIDVFPDDFAYEGEKYVMAGYQMLVRAEVMRGRFRNSFGKPEPFIPGKPADVRFTLPAVAHTFKKGHQLMIQVQSSWFPLVDRNPQQFVDIYHCSDQDFISAGITIYHQKDASSRIILLVIASSSMNPGR